MPPGERPDQRHRVGHYVDVRASARSVAVSAKLVSSGPQSAFIEHCDLSLRVGDPDAHGPQELQALALVAPTVAAKHLSPPRDRPSVPPATSRPLPEGQTREGSSLGGASRNVRRRDDNAKRPI